MKRIVAFFAERDLIVNLISIALIISGLLYLTTANKEAFPPIEYPYVICTTAYAGSTAEDIEKHITKPIEDELREVDGIEELYSNSIESASIVIMKLDPDLGDKKSEVIKDIKDAIDAVTDLPKESERPVTKEIKMSLISVLTISISNAQGIKSDLDELELRKVVKNLEDRIIDIPGVAKVTKTGYREREMMVEVNPYKLANLHVGLNDITMALAQKNVNFPGGTVQYKNEDVLVRTMGEITSAKDIGNILIRANDLGYEVRIKDVAVVKDTFEDETVLNKFLGKKAITLNVLKKENADIIKTVNLVQKDIKVYEKTIDKKYKIHNATTLSKFVKRRLDVLVNNGIVGLVLVIAVLFLTLGWRISIVTALGIPLAFSGAFIWMGLQNVTINLMSMFGLIMVLGMVVDDAIVVAENVYRHLEEGEPVREAVINGTSEVITPVLGTILTTIAAFAPLMFMKGVMGQFVWTLPAVVSVALIASWVESMFILPSHIMEIEKRRKSSVAKSLEKEGSLHHRIKERYVKLLALVIRNKYKAVGAISIFFMLSMVLAYYQVKFVVFPQGNIEKIIILAEAKTGTNLIQMNDKLKLIEKVVSNLDNPVKQEKKSVTKTPSKKKSGLEKVKEKKKSFFSSKKKRAKELDNYVTLVGKMRERPMDPNEKTGNNYGTIDINLTPEADRDRVAGDIIEDLRNRLKKKVKIGNKLSSVMDEFETLEFKVESKGPPIGKPVSISIRGNDFTQLKRLSKKFKEYMKTIKGLKDVKDDFEEGKQEIRLIVNESKAAMAGISVMDIASTVRICYSGNVATKIKKTDEEISIRVIYPDSQRNTLNSLYQIKVSNRMGNLIPIYKVADFKWTKGIPVINRHNWKRVIRVSADINEKAKGVSSMSVNKMLKKHFPDIEKKNPGVYVNFEGEFKDTQESLSTLGRSFMIAILVIYIILVGIFKSLRDPIVIVGVLPLTAIGIVWAFFFHGMVFSFIAMMGSIGLAGVVVNDSIVYIDFIKRSRIEEGLNVFDATMKAGGHRLRPIFLTTVTTFFGLIPTAYGIGGDDPMIRPMAVAMAWGLAFGTFITLIATPLLYNVLVDLKEKITRKPDVIGTILDPATREKMRLKEELDQQIEDVAKKIVNKEKKDMKKLHDEFDQKLGDLESKIKKKK